jgi:hypothetical protein
MLAPVLLPLFAQLSSIDDGCAPERWARALEERGAHTASVSVPLQLEHENSRVVGRVLLLGGERRLTGQSCREVIEALALVVAMEGPAPAPRPSTPTPAAALTPRGELRAEVQALGAPSNFGVGLGVGARLGAVPGLGATTHLHVEWAGRPRWPVRGQLSWSFGGQEALTPGADVRFDLVAVGLEFGPRWFLSPDWSLEGAARAEGGLLWAQPSGLLGPSPGPQLWGGLGPVGRIGWWGAWPWILGLEAAAVLPFHRPRFLIEGEGVAYQVSWITPEVRLTAGLHFW